MSTIPQNQELLKQLKRLIKAHRPIFKQERIYQRAAALFFAEIIVFARHTITQMLMSLGQTEADWSSWYRLFSQKRFPYEQASGVMFQETLKHVGENELYVVAGDGAQTRRSSRKMEGAHWLHNPQSPVFKPRDSYRPTVVQRELAHSSRKWIQSSGAFALDASFLQRSRSHWRLSPARSGNLR